jgi:hypothetical protein
MAVFFAFKAASPAALKAIASLPFLLVIYPTFMIFGSRLGCSRVMVRRARRIISSTTVM